MTKLLVKLVLAEAEALLEMSLVARSVLNRKALILSCTVSASTYSSKSSSLEDIIYAKGQYQPVINRTINRNYSKEQIEKAKKAIELAYNTAELDSELIKLNYNTTHRLWLLQAIGFRTLKAFYDSSQDYHSVIFGNHRFNGDRFSFIENLIEIFSTNYS